MSKIYIYSTLTASQNYSTPEGKVLIHGGANLERRGVLDTPRGVVTAITPEQYALLKQHNTLFQQHMKNGFVSAQTSKVDPDEVAADLQGPDASTQTNAGTLADAIQADGRGIDAVAPKATRGRPAKAKD